VAEQPRGKNARIVHDEQVTGNKVLRQIREYRVLDRAGAMEDKQAGSPALLRGILRDQRLGQIEIEVIDVHDIYEWTNLRVDGFHCWIAAQQFVNA
jgi:hypothetical protein